MPALKIATRTDFLNNSKIEETGSHSCFKLTIKDLVIMVYCDERLIIDILETKDYLVIDKLDSSCAIDRFKLFSKLITNTNNVPITVTNSNFQFLKRLQLK